MKEKKKQWPYNWPCATETIKQFELDKLDHARTNQIAIDFNQRKKGTDNQDTKRGRD